ncbi:MAG: J domain-containing protein [Planctomycetota bacterium]
MTSSENISEATRVLGLPERATIDQVRRAYKKLVLKHHPDRHGSAATAEMVRITAAYDTVMAYCREYPIPFADPVPGAGDPDWWMAHFGDNM